MKMNSSSIWTPFKEDNWTVKGIAPLRCDTGNCSQQWTKFSLWCNRRAQWWLGLVRGRRQNNHTCLRLIDHKNNIIIILISFAISLVRWSTNRERRFNLLSTEQFASIVARSCNWLRTLIRRVFLTFSSVFEKAKREGERKKEKLQNHPSSKKRPFICSVYLWVSLVDVNEELIFFIMPKKSSDINKPRPPVTAYNLFVRTCRDELRRKHPLLTVEYNVISRKCSERWKMMSDQEKKRFNDTADSQRKRYKEDLASYVQTQTIKQESATSSILLQTPATQYLPEPVLSPLIKQELPQQHTLIMPTVTPLMNNSGMVNLGKKPAKKRERKQKDPLAPKKPLSAYFLFCADERPKVQSSQAGVSLIGRKRVTWKKNESTIRAMLIYNVRSSRHPLLT